MGFMNVVVNRCGVAGGERWRRGAPLGPRAPARPGAVRRARSLAPRARARTPPAARASSPPRDPCARAGSNARALRPHAWRRGYRSLAVAAAHEAPATAPRRYRNRLRPTRLWWTNWYLSRGNDPLFRTFFSVRNRSPLKYKSCWSSRSFRRSSGLPSSGRARRGATYRCSFWTYRNSSDGPVHFIRKYHSTWADQNYNYCIALTASCTEFLL